MSVKLDLQRFQKKLTKKTADLVSRRIMAMLATEAIRMIQTRTRAGYGVKRTGQPATRLRPLSPAYIKQRRRMRLSQYTSPGKSNLTRSGRLLAGLRYTTRDGAFVVKPTGRSREGVPNELIAEYVTQNGRAFMNLSRNEIAKLAAFFNRIAKQRLNI